MSEPRLVPHSKYIPKRTRRVIVRWIYKQVRRGFFRRGDSAFYESEDGWAHSLAESMYRNNKDWSRLSRKQYDANIEDDNA